MASKFGTWWQKKHHHLFIAIGIMVLLIAFIVFIVAVSTFGWDWTGFNGYSPPTPYSQRGKTLWDWLQLLFVPAMIAFGGLWFTRQQGKVSERQNTDNQHETALQAYLDKMSELLLEKHLKSHPEDEVREIAGVRTLTILARLDAHRKRSVLHFLHESGLIDKSKRIVNLSGANLSSADLHGIDLRSADLHGANLRGADLSGTILTQEQWEKAESLQGATMPDGSTHP